MSTHAVFDSVRRGYSELEVASNADIIDYFSVISADSMVGHVSNIKGILFEKLYVEQLAEQGIEVSTFEAINHPVVDVAIYDDGEVVNELQLKATDSVSYINDTLEKHPDIQIVVTSEVADRIDSSMVINSGIEDAALEEAVLSTLLENAVNPVSPISILGWLFGLPF
jgi:DNA-binding NarL/FixJ family response regulator